jgi:hypothetical protein
MYLTKREYARWEEIQDDYAAYMASFSDFTSDALLEYMESEYPRSSGWPDWPVLIRELDAATAIKTVRVADDRGRPA